MVITLRPRLITGFDGSVNFAGTDGVDDDAVLPRQAKNGDVRAGLLGKTDDIELLQVANPLDDLGGIIDIDGRAEFFGQIANSDTGDLGAGRVKWFGDGHDEMTKAVWRLFAEYGAFS